MRLLRDVPVEVTPVDDSPGPSPLDRGVALLERDTRKEVIAPFLEDESTHVRGRATD